jgi:ATP-binding cassette subfamily C protein CydD
LIPLFAVLVGLHTKATTQRQWRLLARLGGHFLDVVEGLPTLKLFGRGQRQAEVIGQVTDEYRAATMSSLRIAFLSGFVLELAAALATALVAVEVGLRLLAGHMSCQTALLVLLLTPEAYLPLRGRRPVPRQHRRRRRSPGRLRDPRHPGAGGSDAGPAQRPARGPAPGHHQAGRSHAHLPGTRSRRPARREPGYPAGRPDRADRAERGGQELAARAAAPVRGARSAGADWFIEDLPQGYATLVGERGLRLSSGQRQQIALARAFLRDAPLLLLDEPAAHLDAASAARLDAALGVPPTSPAPHSFGRTVIQVSHRAPAQAASGRLLTLD